MERGGRGVSTCLPAASPLIGVALCALAPAALTHAPHSLLLLNR